MPTACVPINRCNTRATGWLNANHPTVADGQVTRQVCFHWNSNCCYWSTNIQVRNCGEYFVYLLSGTPGCSLRYCGTDQIPRRRHFRYCGTDTRSPREVTIESAALTSIDSQKKSVHYGQSVTMNKLQEDLRVALLAERNPWSDSFTVQNFSYQSGRGNELFFNNFSLINQLPSLGNLLNLCNQQREVLFKFVLNKALFSLMGFSLQQVHTCQMVINNVKITIPVFTPICQH